MPSNKRGTEEEEDCRHMTMHSIAKKRMANCDVLNSWHGDDEMSGALLKFIHKTEIDFRSSSGSVGE